MSSMHVVKEWATLKRIVTLYIDFLDEASDISKSKGFEPKFSNEVYQEYLRLKSNNLV